MDTLKAVFIVPSICLLCNWTVDSDATVVMEVVIFDTWRPGKMKATCFFDKFLCSGSLYLKTVTAVLLTPVESLLTVLVLYPGVFTIVLYTKLQAQEFHEKTH